MCASEFGWEVGSPPKSGLSASTMSALVHLGHQSWRSTPVSVEGDPRISASPFGGAEWQDPHSKPYRWWWVVSGEGVAPCQPSPAMLSSGARWSPPSEIMVNHILEGDGLLVSRCPSKPGAKPAQPAQDGNSLSGYHICAVVPNWARRVPEVPGQEPGRFWAVAAKGGAAVPPAIPPPSHPRGGEHYGFG